MRSLPASAAALSLAEYRLASRWQSLIRFWLCVLTVAVALASTLEILGPPERAADVERVSDAPQTVDRAQPALPAPPVGNPVEAGHPEAERPLASAVPMRPKPDQPAPPVPDFQPPDAAPPEAPRPRAALVLHPARADSGAGIASRLAAQAGLSPNQVDVGPVADARSEAVIRFYAAGDHPLARRLGKELARMGYSWRIENFAQRPWAWKDQAVEVFLPDK